IAATANSSACVCPPAASSSLSMILFSQSRTPSASQTDPAMYTRAYKIIVSAPPLLWVVLFLLLPYALMFAHSFWAVQDGALVHHWNLDNYKKLFTNPLYAEVLFRTMR